MKLQRKFWIGPALLLAAAACGDGWLPGGHLQSESTELRRYNSCSALENDLEESLIHEAWANIERIDDLAYPGGAEDSAGGGGGSGRQEGVDYSGTNNQEAGVDEADYVKTDGYHLYAINGNRLHIFSVPQFGELNAVSVTPLEGSPTQMLLHKDANRVVVFSRVNSSTLPVGHPLRVALRRNDSESYWRVPYVSKVTVFDITNRAAPRTDREFYFEGFYQTARRIDTTIRVASYAYLDRHEVWGWYDDYRRYGEARTKEIVARRIRALSLADLIPQLYARTAGGQLETRSLSQGSCRSFYRPTDSHARGISSILSFDLLAQELTWDADHVVSNWSTFYSSGDTLVLAENAHDWWWYWWYRGDSDQLNVHAFDVSQPGTTSYIGSGRVYGQLSDQFAIDEEDGAIRLATTKDLWWRWWAQGDEARPEMTNHIWVLEHQPGTRRLVNVGHVGGIAPGERITAARFLGDKGFITTFRRVDPLFTLDLSDRRNPRVVGELKIPGFSTYLHPMEDGKLLSIGVGGDDNGANWRTTVSMFDVGNFAAPQATSVLPIAAEGGWGWSEALWEHKAFTYWAPKQLLAIPQSNYQQVAANGRVEYNYLSKLELVNVDPATGLSRGSSIDHSAYYNVDRQYYWQNVDIRRSIFMGDYIYALSDKAITVHRLSDMALMADETLPGYRYGDWWWGAWEL
ncbi:MAG: beta-propeller domain-containing protein [Kofleriaceae bacterium]